MTDNPAFESDLRALCGGECIKKNEPMSSHTTFRTGGPADYYVRPEDRESFLRVLGYLKDYEEEYLILGKGSNLLVGDKGYRGTVVDTTGALAQVTVDGDRISAGAGASLSAVSNMAAEASLTGMEFASGIPGTIGGAVFMNAGAYGGEMSRIVSSVELVVPSGDIVSKPCSEMGFAYRTSIVQKESLTVLGANIKLERGDRKEIITKIKELGEQRASKQPLEFPSAGSTFKRPEGYFAGKLITDAGLSGLTIGGARVSPKHNGFIINLGDATSADIMALIDEVRERVQQSFGITLVPEVRIIGEF